MKPGQDDQNGHRMQSFAILVILNQVLIVHSLAEKNLMLEGPSN
jgi:hypothetical protein